MSSFNKKVCGPLKESFKGLYSGSAGGAAEAEDVMTTVDFSSPDYVYNPTKSGSATSLGSVTSTIEQDGHGAMDAGFDAYLPVKSIGPIPDNQWILNLRLTCTPVPNITTNDIKVIWVVLPNTESLAANEGYRSGFVAQSSDNWRCMKPRRYGNNSAYGGTNLTGSTLTSESLVYLVGRPDWYITRVDSHAWGSGVGGGADDASADDTSNVDPFPNPEADDIFLGIAVCINRAGTEVQTVPDIKLQYRWLPEVD